MNHLRTVCAALVTALALASFAPVASAADVDGHPIPPCPPVSLSSDFDERPMPPVPPCPPVSA